MRVRAVRAGTIAMLVMMTSAAGVAAAVDAAAPTPCNGITSFAGPFWMATTPPQLDTVALLRTVAYAPDRMYAADGRSTLVVTDDGGCSWSDISPAAPALAGLSGVNEAVTITSIAAPSSSTSASYLYVGADITPTNALPVSLPAQPVVYVSKLGGRPDFVSSSGNGLPAIGNVKDVAASDLAPRTVYTLIANAGSDDGIWASNDAGQSWNGPLSGDTSLTGLRVDPTVSNHLYAVKPGVGVVLSTDGGRSFAALAHTSGDVQSFSAAAGSGGAQLMQGYASTSRFDLSVDRGRSWQSYTVPEHAAGVAIGAVAPVGVVYDDKRLSFERLYRGRLTSVLMTPGTGSPAANSVQVSATTGIGASVTAISADHRSVLRAVFDYFSGKLAAPSLTPIHLLPRTTVKQFPSTLSSPVTKVQLAPGKSEDVPYQLLLPRTPSPVDMMFLVDTTASTDQTIDGVRLGVQTVVNEMRSTGLDVEFGVGDFKDYPYTVGGQGDEHDYPYRLRRKIGPADVALQQALTRLHADGGGDQPESDLTALYESTVGNGEKFGKHWVVRPGGDAGYRPSSLRLAILATDEMFHREADYPGPHWSQTVRALNQHGVHQIGLAVESTDSEGKPVPGLFESLPDQRRMAIATHAVAPDGGVDCDGNGTTDIAAGSPLVCAISKPPDNRFTVGTGNGGPQIVVGSAPPPVHLAPLIVALAENIPDNRAVALRVTGAPTGVARTVSSPTAPIVNVRDDNTLGYVVRYTCPESPRPHTWPLTVTALAGARPVTSTRTTLVCSPLPPRPSAAVVPPAAVTAVAGVAPGAPPNPPPNVNANANPNPAVNPNAGVAQQDEQQPELALAESDQAADDPGTSLAMSRRSADDMNAAWMLGAAGLMTAAAGFATRSRWRTARQRG